MDPRPLLTMLVRHGCRFVVVGSSVGWLLDDGARTPHDLDIVVPDTAADRAGVAGALASCGGWMETAIGPRALDDLQVLPDLSWQVGTRHGPVDVHFGFIDGTTHADHLAKVDA